MISIIVPIYNVEKYLRRCIDSVITQNYDDWELILVEDGSPDNSSAICDDYSKKYENIHVIHKRNEGLPAARWSGWKVAKGEFVIHLDADDWLFENALQLMSANITQGCYDFVKYRVCRVFDDGHRELESSIMAVGSYEGTEVCTKMLLHGSIHPYLHSAIYRRCLFSDKVFASVVNACISVGEDWVTNMLISDRVYSFAIVDKPCYSYFVNRDSMMGSSIIGWEYGLRIRCLLNGFYAHCSEETICLADVRKVCGAIQKFFVPELGYRQDQYKMIQSFLRDEDKKKQIKDLVPNKYLLFIDCPFMYKLYSRLYRFFFLFLKQQGRLRRVL